MNMQKRVILGIVVAIALLDCYIKHNLVNGRANNIAEYDMQKGNRKLLQRR